MPRLVLVSLALLALGTSGATPAASNLRRAQAGAGISVALPAGWQLVRFPVSDCSDPVQRLVAATRPASKLSVSDPLASGATLVVLTEDRVNVLGSFSKRPSRFRLPAKPDLLEGCCDTPAGPEYMFSFRDNGRNFQAYVFARNLRTQAVRVEALAILDSLRVSRRQ